jgi:hypothetical protein
MMRRSRSACAPWADENADAARALGDVDRRRSVYIERMLVDAGHRAAARGDARAIALLGLSRRRVEPEQALGERLDRMVTELKLIGLGGPATRTAAVADRPRRRSGRG